MLDDASLLVRRDQPLSAAVGRETVMFDPASGAYFALGETGTRVWELLAQPVGVAQLCATLAAEFAVPADTCRRDVEAFVTQLADAGLIDVRP